MITILVLEKENTIYEKINKALKEVGYDIVRANNVEEALRIINGKDIHMVLSGYSSKGCDLCHLLRGKRNTVPFIIIIENAAPKDKRIIFRSYSDGYLEYPFDPEELQMKVQNLLWRCNIVSSVDVKYSNCTLHSDTYTLEIDDKIVELRKMEFLLLEKLLSYPGRIFTRRQLMDELWGYECESGPRTVDTHIRLLRRKLKGYNSIRIQTIRGIGYRAIEPKNRKNDR